MILGDVLTEVRRMVQDVRTPQRYTDDELLGYANQTLKTMALLRPDLFATIADIPCVDGDWRQELPADGIRVIEIYQIKDGSGVTEVNRETLDQTYPQWRSDTPAPTINWMRNVRNPRGFFIYPPAPGSQILVGEYAQTPISYDQTTPVDHLPDAYFPTVVHGTVYLVESVDNEHVDNGRAALFQKSFTDMLLGTTSNRPLTDTEDAGMEDEQVI